MYAKSVTFILSFIVIMIALAGSQVIAEENLSQRDL